MSQITLVLNVSIACHFKIRKDDKDGQGMGTPSETERCSSFFHNNMINVFCGIILQMLTFLTICLHTKVRYDKVMTNPSVINSYLKDG